VSVVLQTVVTTPPSDAEAPVLSKRQVAVAVARRGGPKVLEATVIPGVLFYVSLRVSGVGLAYLTAVAWLYACVVRRCVLRHRVPGLLVIGAVGITVRTLVAIWTGSTFVYFAQPVAVTVATGCVFAASLVVGRPLIGRFAGDFWLMTPEVAANRAVLSLFRGLTALWAAVNIVTAAITLVLLVTLPVTTFVLVKQVSGISVTITAIYLTIRWSHRTACSEGIVRAPCRAVVPGR